MNAEKKSEQANSKQWDGAFAAVSQSIDRISKNPEPLFLLVAVYLVLFALEASASFPGTDGSTLRSGSYETLGSLIFLLALPVYSLALADRKKISISEFMRFNATKYLFVFIVTILAVLIFLGSLVLLIFPIIWTVAWYAFCNLVVVDKGLGPIEALKESKRLAQHHKGKVWGVVGVSVLLALAAAALSALPVIGTLLSTIASSIMAVVSSAAIALLYRWTQAQ